MFRRLLLVAATAAAFAASPAQAAPPYCVYVTDGSGVLLYTCAIGSDCVVYGGGLPPQFGFEYCVPWP